MLREEYEKPRKPPRLPQKPTEPTTFSWTVADATEADLPDVLALYRHYVRNSVVTFDEKPPTLTQFRSKFRHLQKLGYPFRIARSPQGTLLGYAYVFPFREKSAFRKTVESSIYLGPAATGRGLGKVLLADLISACTEAGLKEIIAVIADQGAEASLALHQKFGFVETGRMGKVGFKFERWIGIILMQRSLP
ncbi:MAG: GNAT family N-acetyltransferase [Pontimonas sp.]|jgi:L-amino acid N-acyltransferase YncA|nr:GNAT family N-acetyltransferase [Pontimonas sp.]